MFPVPDDVEAPAGTQTMESIWCVDRRSRSDIARNPHWAIAYDGQRRDGRYYELVTDTIREGFEHGYFVFSDKDGRTQAILPFFLHYVDLVAGLPRGVQGLIARIRRFWPQFLRLHALFAGCPTSEGHFDGQSEIAHRMQVRSLGPEIRSHARDLGASLVVFKEFPFEDRDTMGTWFNRDFSGFPASLPFG